jgi:hypothetical protein
MVPVEAGPLIERHRRPAVRSEPGSALSSNLPRGTSGPKRTMSGYNRASDTS